MAEKKINELDLLIETGAIKKYELETLTDEYYGFTKDKLTITFNNNKQLCLQTGGDDGDDLSTNSYFEETTILDSEHIWFHHVDFIGDNFDYSVIGWDAAKLEAIRLIEHGIGYVCDENIKLKIEDLIKTDWEYAVKLYNEHNAVKEFISYRKGRYGQSRV